MLIKPISMYTVTQSCRCVVQYSSQDSWFLDPWFLGPWFLGPWFLGPWSLGLWSLGLWFSVWVQCLYIPLWTKGSNIVFQQKPTNEAIESLHSQLEYYYFLSKGTESSLHLLIMEIDTQASFLSCWMQWRNSLLGICKTLLLHTWFSLL